MNGNDGNGLVGAIASLPKAPFLGEPAWKWFIAFGTAILFLNAWRGIQDHMR